MRTMIRRGPVAAALLAALACGSACTSEPAQQNHEQHGQPAPAASAKSAPNTPQNTRPGTPSKRQAKPAAPKPKQQAAKPNANPPKQTVKRVDSAADCKGLLRPPEIGRATGTRAAAAPAAGPGDCSFDLTGGGGGFAQVVLTEDQAEITGRTRQTTVAGNKAWEQDESDGRVRSCRYLVRMNDDRQLNTLMVNVQYFNSGKNSCQAARGLARTAFHRLPTG